MKLSVSLSDRDVEIIDAYARSAGLSSRSAVIQHAIHHLHDADLEQAYTEAWQEWESSGEALAWEAVTGDGLADQAHTPR